MDIKAAVTHDKGEDFKIEDVQLDEPKHDEVLIKIVATGVCHTDAVARDQDVPVPLPAVLGHEGAGIVEKVGEGIRSVAPGDHVVLLSLHAGIVKIAIPAILLTVWNLTSSILAAS